MPTTLEALSKKAMVLPPDQRLTLARRLLDSVDLEPEPGAAAAWESELARRIRDLDSGKTEALPAGEVFARLRKVAPGR